MNNHYLLLITGTADEDYTEFYRRIVQTIRDELLPLKPELLRVTLTVENPPRFSIYPFRRGKMALITYRGNTEPVWNSPGLRWKIRPEHSTPVPPVDLHQPVCMLTCFHKKRNITHETFHHRWYDRHTPFSLKYLPLIGYVRNRFDTVPAQESPLFDGIVEEFFAESRDLLNIFRFLGTVLLLPVRITQLFFDINSFIDLGRIETYYCTSFDLIGGNAK